MCGIKRLVNPSGCRLLSITERLSISARGSRFGTAPLECHAVTTSRRIFSANTLGSQAFGDSKKMQCVIHDLFMSYAKPGSDSVPCLRKEDLKDLLVSIGENPSKQTLQEILAAVDENSSGTIELGEFLAGCDKILGHGVKHKDDILDVGQLIETFKTLDRDGNGILSLDELEGLLSAAGGRIEKQDAEEILRLADRNGNGEIDLSEFIAFVTDPEHLRHSWRLTSGFRVLLVIGGPGSGKGMLCSRLVEDAGVKHFSSGEALRKEVTSGSCLGRSIASMLEEGQLVPPSTMIALLKKQLGKFPGEVLALDGFPRTLQNYKDFDDICGSPEGAIYIDVPDDVMIERIIRRGKSGSGRSDDNLETAKTRIENFHMLTKPTLESLKAGDIPVYALDGGGTPEDVWDQLVSMYPPIQHRVQARQVA